MLAKMVEAPGQTVLSVLFMKLNKVHTPSPRYINPHFILFLSIRIELKLKFESINLIVYLLCICYTNDFSR
jgi:hypothetical protein